MFWLLLKRSFEIKTTFYSDMNYQVIGRLEAVFILVCLSRKFIASVNEKKDKMSTSVLWKVLWKWIITLIKPQLMYYVLSAPISFAYKWGNECVISGEEVTYLALIWSHYLASEFITISEKKNTLWAPIDISICAWEQRHNNEYGRSIRA